MSAVQTWKRGSFVTLLRNWLAKTNVGRECRGNAMSLAMSRLDKKTKLAVPIRRREPIGGGGSRTRRASAGRFRKCSAHRMLVFGGHTGSLVQISPPAGLLVFKTGLIQVSVKMTFIDNWCTGDEFFIAPEFRPSSPDNMKSQRG